MQVVKAELESNSGAFLAHFLFGFVLDLLDDFFDTRGMDAPVGNQALDGLLRNLPSIGIEP